MQFYELARDAVQHLDPNASVRETLALRLGERIAKLHMVLNRLELAEREFSHIDRASTRSANRVVRPRRSPAQSLIRARMNRMAEATATAETALQLAYRNE